METLPAKDQSDVTRQAKILDACCGSRMMWFNRENPIAVYVDNRRISEVLCDGSVLTIAPDIVADFTELPFSDESFHLVVFDPPHLTRLGTDTGWIAKKYGRLVGDWKDMISEGFKECFRVLKINGTLVFKWSEHDVPLVQVLELAPIAPLFGNNAIGGDKRAKNHWLCFFKS